MAESNRSNDAWATIRGFVYQVQLSIKYWINLEENQYLELESVEDIDIITEKLLETYGSITESEISRALGQVKHLEQNISLRSDPFKEAIVNFCENMCGEPSEDRRLLFLTNANVGSENNVAFFDKDGNKIKGLHAWKQIQNGQPIKNEGAAIDLIQEVVTESAPKKYRDKQARWIGFKNYFSGANRKPFIQKVIVSENNLNLTDLKEELIETIAKKFYRSPQEAEKLYNKLFTKVFEVLSIKDEDKDGHKVLFNQQVLSDIASKESEELFADKILYTVKNLFTSVDKKLDTISAKIDQLLIKDDEPDNAIPIIQDILKHIDQDIKALKLRESYAALCKLESSGENSYISQPIKNKLLARIYFLKALSIHNGEDCKEDASELYKKAYTLDQDDIKYQEKVCWDFFSKKDIESANYVAGQILSRDINNPYALFIKRQIDKTAQVPPFVKNSFVYRRLEFNGLILEGQNGREINWKDLLNVVDKKDIESLEINNITIHYWYLVAYGLFNEAFSGELHVTTIKEFKDCFRTGGFASFEKIVKALFQYLSYHKALSIRNDFIGINWMNAILEFLNTSTNDSLHKASAIISTLETDMVKKQMAFFTTIMCFLGQKWQLAIELTDHYVQDKVSLIGTIRVNAFIALNKEDAAKKEVEDILLQVEKVDDYNFNVIIQNIYLLSSLNEDPFFIIAEQWNEVKLDKDEFKTFLLAWAYFCGQCIRNRETGYDLAAALKQLSQYQWSSAQKIWLADMYGKGCGRYGVAKNYFQEVLQETPFINDSQLWTKYFKAWYHADEDKRDLLTLLAKRRLDHADYASIALEFNLLASYREYDALIELFFEVLDKLPVDIKFEIIYFVIAVISQQAPDKRGKIHTLFTDELIDAPLHANKKLNLVLFLSQLDQLFLAIKILYKDIKTYPSPIAKKQYIGLYSLNAENLSRISSGCQSLDSVNTDCVVELTDKYKNASLIEISPENKTKIDLQKSLSGKKVGDTIKYEKHHNFEQQLKIRAIYGKYLGLNLLIQEEVRKDSTSDIPVAIGQFNHQDIKASLQQMMEMAGGGEKLIEDQQHKAELFKSFKSRELTFLEFFSCLDKDQPIETYLALTIGSYKKFPCLPMPENIEGLTSNHKLIIDFTTLIPLHNLHQLYGVLPNNPLICSRIITDFLKERIYSLSKEQNQAGALALDNYVPYFIPYPENYFEQKKQYYTDLLSWIEMYCTIEFSYRTGDLLVQLQNNFEVFHKWNSILAYAIDNALLSEKQDYVLLTDDVFYHKFFHKDVIPLQSVFRRELFTRQVKKEQILYYLLENNYIGLFPDKELFLEILVRTDVTQKLVPLLNFLEGTLLYQDNAAMTLYEFLRETYLHAHLSFQKRESLARLIFSYIFKLYEVFSNQRKAAILRKIEKDFNFLPLYLDSIKALFEEEWEKKKLLNNRFF